MTSAPLTVMSSMATRQILAALAADYPRVGGRNVEVVSIGGVEAARRIRAGESFDLALLARAAMRQLADEGHLVPGTLRDFARSSTAMAVPAGVAHPASCEEAALRSLLAQCRRLGVSTGPSGSAVRALLERWKLGGPTLAVVEAPPGVPVARLIAAGEVDLGFQQLSELIGESGIDIVGTVPDHLLPATTFSVGVVHPATDVSAAKALIAYLTAPDAVLIKTRYGMEAPL